MLLLGLNYVADKKPPSFSAGVTGWATSWCQSSCEGLSAHPRSRCVRVLSIGAPSYLSHLGFTGSPVTGRAGWEWQRIHLDHPCDLFVTIVTVYKLHVQFQIVLCNMLLYYYKIPFYKYTESFLGCFFSLTFSIIPNANNQIFQNPKYKVSFLNFLKLVIWVKKNSVRILTHFT